MKLFLRLALILAAGPLMAAADRTPSEATSFDTHKAHFGLGVATASDGVNGTAAGLSGIVLFSPANSLQATFAMPTVTPLTLSGGLTYRGRVDYYETVGLHVGLGARIGAASGGAMFATFFVPVGLQIRPMPALLLIVEGGPMVSVGGGVSENFSLKAFTAETLGLSVHYIF